MRVCFVNSLYAPNALGGAEYTVQYLAEGLVRGGHDVSVVSLAPDGQTTMAERNGVRAHYLKLANLYWPFWAERDRPPGWKRALWHAIEAFNPLMTRRLMRVFATERPDVISCHNMLGFSVAPWLAARRLGVPLVQTLHDYFLACPGAIMFRNGANCVGQCSGCRIFTARRRALSGAPRALTSVSLRTLQRLEACGFFPGASDKTVIFGSNADTPAVPERADQPPGSALRLGFLGRIEPIKGVEVLMQAMASLPEGTASLVIGGRCPDEVRARLLAQAGTADVTFLGHVDPASFFPQIDALVVPSVWEEPLGRVIHEAMAFGVPSIASRTGGIPEIVEDGQTGYLFEPGDVAGLAALILRLRAHGLPAARLGATCKTASLRFTPATIFDAYFNVFARAASGAATQAAA